jgi:Ca2+-binding EF-hand superfamily protein
VSDSLSSEDISEFVDRFSERIQSLNRLRGDLDTLLPFYVAVVVHHFTFFIPSVNGIDFWRFVTSKQFVHFVEMERHVHPHNPFALRAASALYNLFAELDGDCDGMLSCGDVRVLKKLSLHLVPAFVERYFNAAGAVDGLIDFDGFLGLVIPLRNLATPAAAKFFFELFDVDGDGTMADADLMYFHRSLAEEVGPDTPPFKTFAMEVRDKCRIKDGEITEESLVQSGVQDGVIHLIINCNEWLEQNDAQEPGHD